MSKKSKNEKEQLWEVENIVDKRYYKKNNELQYLIKWKGWDESENTWEPIFSLRFIPNMVEQFEIKYKKQMEKKQKMEQKREQFPESLTNVQQKEQKLKPELQNKIFYVQRDNFIGQILKIIQQNEQFQILLGSQQKQMANEIEEKIYNKHINNLEKYNLKIQGPINLLNTLISYPQISKNLIKKEFNHEKFQFFLKIRKDIKQLQQYEINFQNKKNKILQEKQSTTSTKITSKVQNKPENSTSILQDLFKSQIISEFSTNYQSKLSQLINPNKINQINQIQKQKISIKKNDVILIDGEVVKQIDVILIEDKLVKQKLTLEQKDKIREKVSLYSQIMKQKIIDKTDSKEESYFLQFDDNLNQYEERLKLNLKFY